MKIILGSRQSGKTVQLIKECAENGGYIVCRSAEECRRIAELAEKMGLDIPYPLTYYELKMEKYYGKGIRKIHIDNAKDLIEYMCNLPVKSMTIQRKGDLRIESRS